MTSFGRFLFSAGGYPLTGEVGGEGEVVSVAGRAAVVLSCTHVIASIHAAAHLAIMWPFVARGMPMYVATRTRLVRDVPVFGRM